MKRKDGFAPIGAYAAIGDGATTALVALDGSIDFLSLPAVHCPTTFAALLDPEDGGRFALRPSGRFEAERRYVERTNVLETTYRTKDGVARVTEALNLQGGGLLPWRELARRVECLGGQLEFEWCVEARPDWGRAEVQLDRRRGAPVFEGGGVELAVHTWDAGEPQLEDGKVSGAFTLRDGGSALLALGATHEEPIPIPTRADVERRLRETIEVWRTWLGTWSYEGPWEEQVARSALALKLLVHEPNGAIVAAPTTSLPEQIGGSRNYDYRYMWVRDAAFTIDALMRLGLPEQVHESFCCLLRAVRLTKPDLLPFYGVDGQEATRCDELPLRGYRDSRPVRYGNAAASQVQLGAWGDLLETASLYIETGNALDDDTGSLLADCLDRLTVIWPDEDSGIWELPETHSYTASNLASWMAFDRRPHGRRRPPARYARRPLARGARPDDRVRRGALLVGGAGLVRRVRRRRDARRGGAARGQDGLAARVARTAPRDDRRGARAARRRRRAALAPDRQRRPGGRVSRLLVLGGRGARAHRRGRGRGGALRAAARLRERRGADVRGGRPRLGRAARELPAGAQPPVADQRCERRRAGSCRGWAGAGRCGSTVNALFTSARCVNACGKFPS